MVERLRIGEFAALTRLSAKALRLYDDLGLLVPAEVDPVTGYRSYTVAQLPRARIVALLRHVGMPLARIATVLDLPGPAGAAEVRAFWAEQAALAGARRATVEYVGALLSREDPTMTDTIDIRAVAERAVLSAVRHLHIDEAGAVLGEMLGRMRASGPGLPGVAGCPYTVYHGAVSADSDGPVELVRPMADLAAASAAAATLGDVTARVEPGHDEAVVRLTMAQAAWPALLPTLDAVEVRLGELGRTAAGPPRQVFIADWRTAAADDPACELVVPLRPATADHTVSSGR